MSAPSKWLTEVGERKRPPALEGSLLNGLVALRWTSWFWMAAVLTWELYDRQVTEARPDMPHPIIAWWLVGAAGIFTAYSSYLWRTDSSRLLHLNTIGIEMAIGGALLAANDWVWQDVTHTQNLASTWPLAGVLTAGMGFGRRAGVLAGLCLALAGYAGIPLAEAGNIRWSLSRISSGVLFAMAGWAAGYLTYRLREAEKQIADARAREEVARTLHDGVLQTLAVIQRRSGDPDLAAMAREQELELRQFLTGTKPTPEDLLGTLRHLAKRHEQRHGTRVQVVTIEDLPEMPDDTVQAFAGAVGEALTNATKHGEARTVTVFAEPTDDGGLFCSVKDDGSGFVPDEVDEGIGLSRSIRGRISDIGGRVEVRGRPGSGAEIRMWITEGGRRSL